MRSTRLVSVLSTSLGMLGLSLLLSPPLFAQSGGRSTQQLITQRNATELDPQHYGSAAFGLSLASMAHERQYSRLFRS